MIKREEQIKNTLIELLSTTHIDEVNVNEICSLLNIKRQTFYYHYSNIFDVLMSIFQDISFEFKEDESLESFIKRLLDLLFLNVDFNKEIAKSNSKEIILTLYEGFYYRYFLGYLKKYQLTLDEVKDLAKYYSSSLNSQTFYLFTNDNYSKEDIIHKLTKLLNQEDIDILVKRLR
ncbi:MAG TPA: TetR/AcrR family transcriptional regulator [Candidatus Onthovivens sp.]|nr:TetR/AcrR family transcriptional regulator [Candidatus Onthovivens sp.]